MASFQRTRLSLALLMAWTASLPVQAIEIEQRPLTSAQPAPVPAPAAPVRASVTPPAPVAATVAAPAPAASVPAPAAPAPRPVAAAPVPAASNPAWDLFQQIDTLRGTVAQLQGQVEEQQQLIERLREDLKVRYTDLDQRVEALGQRPAPALPAPAAVVDTTPPATAPGTAAPAANPVIPVVAPAATAKPVAAAPAAPAAPAAAPAPAAAKRELTPEEIDKQKRAYLAAYQRFRGEGPAAAIKAMQEFLQQNPDSVFAPNAYYWTGEFQLALDTPDYAAAETNFKRVISDFDGSPKVPSAFYKLGTIADLRNQRPEAQRWMKDLIARFPGSPEARLAQSWLDQNGSKP